MKYSYTGVSEEYAQYWLQKEKMKAIYQPKFESDKKDFLSEYEPSLIEVKRIIDNIEFTKISMPDVYSEIEEGLQKEDFCREGNNKYTHYFQLYSKALAVKTACFLANNESEAKQKQSDLEDRIDQYNQLVFKGRAILYGVKPILDFEIVIKQGFDANKVEICKKIVQNMKEEKKENKFENLPKLSISKGVDGKYKYNNDDIDDKFKNILDKIKPNKEQVVNKMSEIEEVLNSCGNNALKQIDFYRIKELINGQKGYHGKSLVEELKTYIKDLQQNLDNENLVNTWDNNACRIYFTADINANYKYEKLGDLINDFNE